ncbi:Hypothetical predicted protein [Paramuricea clavata]|uniref:Uncharacterized protein n=1 Tax=Paramuricea clavata TaxID=317549 RepID=A0A7D9IX71_PARCT|nr:Hypothetical predicted protein [Paramuricea clavata]
MDCRGDFNHVGRNGGPAEVDLQVVVAENCDWASRPSRFDNDDTALQHMDCRGDFNDVGRNGGPAEVYLQVVVAENCDWASS